MRVLLGRSVGAFIQQMGVEVFNQHFGILVTPRNQPYMPDVERQVWAADNDCFQGLDKPAFVRMLKRISRYSGCLFAVAPDVVGDASATLLRFQLWQPVIHHFGLPVALAAQDGLENLTVPWSQFDALFIGGSTEWKLGHAAALIVREAKQQGKWVHMGRVNSMRRMQYAQSIGCDSVDGTGFVRFSNKYLPLAVRQLLYSNRPLMEGTWF